MIRTVLGAVLSDQQAQSGGVFGHIEDKILILSEGLAGA
jgi:hypothetical protein